MKEKKNDVLDITTDVEEKSLLLLESTENTAKELQEEVFPSLLDSSIKEIEPIVKAKKKSYKRARKNIIRSYEKLFELSDELSGRWADIKQSSKVKIPGIVNAKIDENERSNNHFSRGINLYKLLWIFYIGSFGGVILEMLWCYLQNGYIESRQGLIYGPFNILYGFGAVALSYFLYRFRNHSDWVSFLGGFIVGSVLEYICSWGQEFALGVRSWDYSHLPLNINGRICLFYSLIWGLLGVVWIKIAYPLLSILIMKIPNKIGRVLTWMLLVFFIFNIIASGFVMARWTERHNGKESTSSISRYIDEKYPDERMERIFPNWKFE